MTGTKRPWNARNRRTVAEEKAYQEHLDEVFEKKRAEGEELRWNVLVDTLTDIADKMASLVPERRMEASKPMINGTDNDAMDNS